MLRSKSVEVSVVGLVALREGHYRFAVCYSMHDDEIEIRACRAIWDGSHVADVLPPFVVLPSGRRRAQVRWSESMRERIRVAVETAITAYPECREAAQ
jgi:hypothetical protein